MAQRYLILLFLTGVLELVLPINRKYCLIQPGKTWTVAQAYCRANYTDLATIESDADMVRLQTEAQKQQFSSSAWIGLYREWCWSLGNELLGSLRLWSPGEPSPVGKTQECAMISSSGWVDYPCTNRYYVMCYDGRYTDDGRFVFYVVSKTWYEAQTFCRQQHTDLATIRTTMDDSAIKAKINGSTWIGLIRNTWLWSDKTNVSITTWGPNQPDNANINEHCGYINSSKVFDSRCSDIKPFFCYKEITAEKLIIKFKVQSTEDVNDPKVKAAILKQIYQKLKNHGMEYLMVNFREHLDGKVFHKKNEDNVL